MRVSVVIANHNYARFVGEAIDSALAQTHPDVEVIAVDDGSVDGSAAVLRRYEARGVRIVLQPNRGQAGALNAGVGLATGELIIFLDADDRLLPGAAAAAVAGLAGPVVHVQWPLALTDAAGRRTGEIDPVADLAEGELLSQLIADGPLQWASSGLGAAWARSYLDAVCPIPEPDFKMGADAYLVGLAPLYGSVRALAEPLTLYRRHAANHSGTPFDAVLQFDLDIARKLFLHAARHAHAMGIDVDPDQWEARNWTIKLVRTLEEIDLVVGREVPFVLIDGMELSVEPSSGRRVIPFLERDGEYWGNPDDDAHAITELERLRGTGAQFLALAWPAFWWQEAYRGFVEHVRRRYACRIDNERLQLFALR
jgi:glycosyltransferase involved in cell wall biosynthesis